VTQEKTTTIEMNDACNGQADDNRAYIVSVVILAAILTLLMVLAAGSAQAAPCDPERTPGCEPVDPPEDPDPNLPPNVLVDKPSMAVPEGQTATNSGTFQDPEEDGNLDTVRITASEGTITQSGTTSGTWNWSMATTEVCADQTKTITITATDSGGVSSTASFSLIVRDVQSIRSVPNGKIAYQGIDHDDPDRKDRIYTIDPTGGTPSNVTNNATTDGQPSYSPDGKKIAYSGYDGQDSEIYTINVDGGQKVQLTHNTTHDEWPSYSPDGSKIAYEGRDPAGLDREILTIDVAGGTPSNVTNNATTDGQPSYSPDGKKIAYSGYDGQDSEIYTIDATGGTPFKVTNNTTTDDWVPDYSPDGKKIAYGSSSVSSGGIIRFDSRIYTINATGGTACPVTDNTAHASRPSYSPDGSKIAYARSGGIGDDSEIYTIGVAGGTPVNVTNNTTYEHAPSWGIAPPPDTTKPSTNATRLVEPNAAGWNKENVTVSLKATDDQGGSGVQKITYSASGAQSIAQTDATGDSAQVALDQQGTTTFTYYATDKAGNVEDQKTLTVKIDKSAPTGKVTINNGASRTRSRSVTLTLSATDPSPASGVTQMRISNTQSGLSSAPWEAYSTTKAWTLSSGQGTKTVYVQYRDGAENTSAVVTDTIRFAR
jgi:Tol biopolymer transport system component